MMMVSLNIRDALAHVPTVVITMAVRSPLTKAWKGQMKDVKADQLMYAMFKVG